jgi:hypothetical protein
VGNEAFDYSITKTKFQQKYEIYKRISTNFSLASPNKNKTKTTVQQLIFIGYLWHLLQSRFTYK